MAKTVQEHGQLTSSQQAGLSTSRQKTPPVVRPKATLGRPPTPYPVGGNILPLTGWHVHAAGKNTVANEGASQRRRRLQREKKYRMLEKRAEEKQQAQGAAIATFVPIEVFPKTAVVGAGRSTTTTPVATAIATWDRPMTAITLVQAMTV